MFNTGADNTVVIAKLNEVYLQVSTSFSIAKELQEYFSYFVPGYRFMPAFRNHLWDGKVRLFNSRNNTLYKGHKNNLIDFCNERRYDVVCDPSLEQETVAISDTEIDKFVKKLKLPHVPRDYQISGFKYVIENKRALLVSPTASGKSLLIYLIAKKLNLKTLIVVPTLGLVSQMKGDFVSYGEKENNIHSVYQGQDKLSDKIITVSTWQSLYKMPQTYFKNFDVVIIDECHLAKAESIKGILEKCIDIKYRIGTTGTLDGSKTSRLVLEGLLGPVHQVTTTKQLMDKGQLARLTIKCINLKYSEETCQQAKKYSYPEEIKFLISSDVRNTFLTKLALKLEGNTMVLFHHIEKHGKILYRLANKLNKDDSRKIFYVSGETEVETREEVRRITETETNAIIYASVGVFSTGTNIRNLDNIIFTEPSKSRIRTLQSIGRVLRIGDRSDKATLFDIVDNLAHKKHQNFALKHFIDRAKIYTSEKFDFQIYELNIEENKKGIV